MEYISILPSDLDLSTQHQYLRLPHPRTNLPQLYLPCASTSDQPEKILEVVKISGSKRRTWFIGDSKIEAGTILVHHAVDPLYLVIPIILSLLHTNANAPPPFQRFSDLISTACTSTAFALAEPFSGNKGEKAKEGVNNQDVARLLGMKSVRRVFKLCCERKSIPAGPPSPPPEDGCARPSRGQVYYRPSKEMILRLLKIKIEYFANEERWNRFDHLVRGLGRDGLLGSDINAGLRQAARNKASAEHLAQWLPATITADLLASYDLTELSDHLMNMSAAAIAAAQPIITGVKKDDKAGLKRKLPAASRGVEALKKVNTASMSKMTSFFKPKEEKLKTA